MKALTRATLALALLASTAGLAHAQDHGDHEGRWGQARGEPQPGPRENHGDERQNREAPTMGGWQRDAEGHNWRGAPAGRVEAAIPPRPPQGLVVREGHDGDRMDGDRRGGGDYHPRVYGGDQRPPVWGGDRDGDRSYQNRDQRVRRGWDWDDRKDWSWRDRDHDDWRWRSQNRYRGWDYRPPVGFYSRSWVFGDLLPRSWWAPDYQIVQWWSYGLPRPPYGSQWIRVGDDALLIDRYTGRVCRVVYDVFW